jgi:hypothetical protein
MDEIVRSLRARVPWNVAQKLLSLCDLPRGQGWDRTVIRLSSENGEWQEQNAATLEALKEHILCGEKLTCLYRVDESEKNELIQYALKLDYETSSFSEAYPIILTDEQLVSAEVDEPKIVAIEHYDVGVAVVFASIRIIELRVELDPAEFAEDAREALSGYDELIGIKKTRFEAFDVVWLPYKGDLIEIRVDFLPGMLRSAGQAAHGVMKRSLKKAYDKLNLGTPVDIFPLIRTLYNAADEGTVVELTFGTTTASLKHEKMRRKHLDLRKEDYHVGGKKALTSPIEPYRLGVQWNIKLSDAIASRPEIGLYSLLRGDSLKTTSLHDIVVKNCVGFSDYNFVMERLLAYVQKLGKEALPEPGDARVA